MKKTSLLFFLLMSLHAAVFSQPDDAAPRVKTINGILEGTSESGIRSFKGIPFAAPPVGSLRWREPQPVKNWDGVRKADKFGPRAMQLPIFSDMQFRSDGVSEDCLYLNVWTPAKAGNEHLPVLVYFYGGGFLAGDGSEYRYDGESLARRGIVTVTVNYRLGVFGFFSYPELTRESPHHASGNYGLLDQQAALRWVQQNIAAFGGDPKKVTIAGESAGSFSVSAQMASPLSRNLIAGAIGESGSLLGFTPTASLRDAENAGEKFAQGINKNSLAELRAMPAEDLLKATAQAGYGRFPVCVDGYFFPKSPTQIFEDGEQAHVPLLVGWNSEESNYHAILGKDEPTVENYQKAVEKLYPEHAMEILKVYHADDDTAVSAVATALASDRFIAFSTWKWCYLHSKTGNKAVYRYYYARPRPQMRQENANNGSSTPATGAVHSAEIEYALGNLPTNRVYDWQPEDYKVSAVMESFFVNFIRTGNPNGLGVPYWPAVDNKKGVQLMRVDVESKAVFENHADRYFLLDSLRKKGN